LISHEGIQITQMCKLTCCQLFIAGFIPLAFNFMHYNGAINKKERIERPRARGGGHKKEFLMFLSKFD